MAPALEQTRATAVRLEIPPESAYVAIVRLAITSLGRAVAVDEEKLDDLKIAVSEACANSVLSVQAAGLDAPISVSFGAAEDRLEVVVDDRGGGEAGEGAAVDSQGFSTRRIMSMELLKTLVDELEVTPREGGGIRTRLLLRR